MIFMFLMGGSVFLGCRVHDVHAAFVLCHVLNASWFVVFWCPEAEDQVWTAAKTGTSSLTKSLTNMCKWFIWSQMHLIHFMHCASCYQTFSMCFFRFCRTLSQAFGTVTGISCILAQVTTFQAASSFGRKPSQSNYTLCQSSSLSSSCGKKWTASGKRACIIGPSQCEMMWKIFFLVHSAMIFYAGFCFTRIKSCCFMLFPVVSCCFGLARDEFTWFFAIVDGWGDLSILENPYIQVGYGWYHGDIMVI